MTTNQLMKFMLILHERLFDCAVPSKLLSKLSSYGISGNLLLWIGECLSDIYQHVALNGSVLRNGAT